ncbi:methyltransferase domain-containing protein [Streptomyces calidiresistens]|uniref:Methyltransferase domain-containing protein n=1 Tax=Streptomyces calidiresistens TaxID=1485586 RepID=A0A7W3T3G7_9ACTN|nr:methyltransferase domain-containing protein [Streptomyces calidiresistens]MBB0230245.1 methyltransferase domain-containing protein [Streptomyces calidiresistens]
MTAVSSDFAAVGTDYAAYSEGGRGLLRHELVAHRVLTELGGKPVRVLDVGCGDGEMVLRLATAGHHVTGAEVSAEMLGRAEEKLAAAGVADRVRLVEADIYDLPFEGEVFDAVVCHGVVMYLPDSTEPVSNLARLVAPGGLLSILTKNALAVGVREALRGEYDSALAQIESGQATSMGNLGYVTRGDTPEHLDQLARDNGLTPLPWQGVRIFHDHYPKNWHPEPEVFAEALAVEWAASSRSPYRELGRLVHTVARREATS